MIRDDFAGAGGWSLAARMLSLDPVVGVEKEEAPVLTARAAGHKRWMSTVADARSHPWHILRGYVASPPCQTFAQAGDGAGLAHLTALVRAMQLVAYQNWTPEDAVAQVSDEALDVRSVLVLEPMLVIRRHEPEWIALEQVPGVLPIWEAYAVILRVWGYSVWTGVLSSEAYGVPQVRRRAVLMASRAREVGPPPATHSRYNRTFAGKLDAGVPPWITMAEALGPDWEPTAANPGTTKQQMGWVYRRPSPTIVGTFRPDIVAAPGYRKKGDLPRQRTPGSVLVTLDEAAVLQSFPVGYPWQGSDSERWLQVGNAIPPLLARAILARLTQEA